MRHSASVVVDDRLAVVDPDRVNEDVDRAEPFGGIGNDGARLLGVAEVAEQAAPAAGLEVELLDDSVDPPGIVVGRDDARADPGEALDQRPADAAGAGDQHRGALKTEPGTGGGVGRDRDLHLNFH